MTRIEFEGESSFDITLDGGSLLDIGLSNKIPVVHACGGNARCSTCRVVVLEGEENLARRQGEEDALARQKMLPSNIRLSCQACPAGDIKVRRLVHDEVDISMAKENPQYESTRERDVAILFTDIRSFTPLVERHLPYDIVHILNRYFRVVGDAIFRHGGHIDKYIGDAVMALFGISGGSPEESCRSALLSAKELVAGIKEVSRYTQQHFGEEIVCGVGVHFGTVVLGEFGHPEFTQFTAIGDAVNVASRIEGQTKVAGVPILTSCAVRMNVPDLVAEESRLKTELKGKSGAFQLFEVSC